jgi:hypothetical protein
MKCKYFIELTKLYNIEQLTEYCKLKELFLPDCKNKCNRNKIIKLLNEDI